MLQAVVVGGFRKGVVAAVLDTRVEYTYLKLVFKVTWCALTVGTRTCTGTNPRNCIDKNGHGTHVAGIIAATINSAGNTGVAPDVTI